MEGAFLLPLYYCPSTIFGIKLVLGIFSHQTIQMDILSLNLCLYIYFSKKRVKVWLHIKNRINSFDTHFLKNTYLFLLFFGLFGSYLLLFLVLVLLDNVMTIIYLRYVSNIMYGFGYARTLSSIWQYRVELELEYVTQSPHKYTRGVLLL